MASGSLEVEVIARTEKLEAGLKKTESKVAATSAQMNNMGSGLGKAATGMIKLAAHVAAVEIGAKGLAVATHMFKGDMGAALETAKQLPLGIGPAVTAVADLVDLLTGAEEKMARIKAKADALAKETARHKEHHKLEKAAKATVRQIMEAVSLEKLRTSSLREQIVLRKELRDTEINAFAITDKMKETGLMRFQAAALVLGKIEARRLLVQTKLNNLMTVAFELAASRHDVVDASIVRLERELAIVNETNESKKQALTIEDEMLTLREEMDRKANELFKRMKELRATSNEDDARLADWLGHHVDSLREQFALRVEILEAQRKQLADAERLAKAEEAKAKALEKQQAVEEARKEFAEARAEAETAVRSQVGTFSTAGGAFTIGMDAQLNEAKLLRGISEKSREILFDILQTLGGLVNIPGIA